jgi:hypothetical protein
MLIFCCELTPCRELGGNGIEAIAGKGAASSGKEDLIIIVNWYLDPGDTRVHLEIRA